MSFADIAIALDIKLRLSQILSMNTSPAQRIIDKFGGYQAVADLLNVDVSRVYRWTYAAAKGGTDGVIPGRHQVSLLAAAKARGVDLSPSDFFPDLYPRESPAAPEAA